MKKRARYKFIQSVPKHRRGQAILPDTGSAWRWAQIDGRFYYDYERLPEHRRRSMPAINQLQEQYTGSMAESRLHEIESLVSRALKVEFHEFLHHYAGYSDQHCAALSKASAVVSAACRHIHNNGIDTRKNCFFQDLAEVVNKLQVQYLPKNFRRLKEKVVAVAEGKLANEVIDLPRAGNANAFRLGDAEVVSWMMQLRLHPANYTNAWIIRKISMVCILGGKSVPSKSWFEQKFAEQHTKFLTYGRWGSGRHANQMMGYIPIENAVFAGDCWQMDGTRVNFIPFKDEDGRERFLYIVAVVDVYSGDVIGWHFDTKEDRFAYVDALSMAANMTGHLPYELVLDRFPGHNTEEWRLIQSRLERAGVKVTITSKKTGKAKTERFFGTLQSVFMQDSPYYYGEGVQSSREYAHRSPEYLKAMKQQANREGWTFDDAWREAVRIIELYRNTKYSEYSRRYRSIDHTPAELYRTSDHPHAVRVEPWDYVQLFGLEKRVTIRNTGTITTEIQRVPYTYHVQDYDTLASYKHVTLCYDMEDLGKVYLFEPTSEVNRKFLGEAHEVRAAQMYGPQADKKDVGRMKKRLKEIQERRNAEIQEMVNEGSEVELLLAGYSTKPATTSAENRWLEEQVDIWKDSGKPRLLANDSNDSNDTGEDMPEIDIRSMY